MNIIEQVKQTLVEVIEASIKKAELASDIPVSYTHLTLPTTPYV